MTHILAADVGGTKSRFGHFFHDGRELSLLSTCRLATGDYGDGGELFRALASSDFDLAPGEADRVVVAAAGLVDDKRRVKITAQGWTIDGAALEASLGGTFVVVNDLVAQAWATRSPLATKIKRLLPGGGEGEGGVEAVIASGTGLGKAFIVPDGLGVIVIPSEGGHGAFAVESGDELDFIHFLCDRVGPRGRELDFVVSGRGLAHLQAFLYGEDLSERDVVGALERSPLTVQWMGRFLGRVCRDTALNVLCLGGLTLAGGVLARSPLLVEQEAFREAFLQSATMGSLLASIPVRLFVDEASGLWGAAQAGLEASLREI